MANHPHFEHDAVEGSVIGTILSIGIAVLRETIYGEAVHFVWVILGAIFGAIAVFFTNYLLRKWFP